MAAPNNPQLEPAEIARETIRRMAVERIAPTPDNYRRIYGEIARIAEPESLEEALARALKRLPRDSSERSKWVAAWEKLLQTRNWRGLPALLQGEADQRVAEAKRWPDAIRELLRAWSVRQTKLPPQRKKEALERVLINFGSDPQLPEKLRAMSQSWIGYASDAAAVDVPDDEAQAETAEGAAVPASPRLTALRHDMAVLQEMLRSALQYGLVPRLEGYPELQQEAQQLFDLAQQASGGTDWQALARQLKALFVRVELIGADERAVRQDLLALLRLLIDNIGELVADDQWLRGQIAVVQTIISSPLEKAQIKEAEKSLKEVIYKQGALKHSLTEAKHNFKQMVATFIERLGAIADTTGSYHGKVAGYYEKLAQTDDILQINALVESLMRDTSEMQSSLLRSQEVLAEQRQQAEAAAERVRQLEMELTALGEKVRIDQLTNTLNRRGLDDAFGREIARAQRGAGNLSVALLDIDNFKRINDDRGHDAGDAALRHLADVVRETVRPTDVVARFGGEEFVVLLPETGMSDAARLMVRLQRELTRKIFLHNNERLLITFSAGVALFDRAETPQSVLHRADQAMYLAKSRGKNLVLTERDLAQAGESPASSI